MDNCTIIPQDNNYYISHHPPLWLVFVMLAIGIIIAIVVILILYRFRTYIWKLVSGYCRHRVCSKLYLVHCLFINGHFMSGYTEGLEHFLWSTMQLYLCKLFSQRACCCCCGCCGVCCVVCGGAGVGAKSEHSSTVSLLESGYPLSSSTQVPLCNVRFVYNA